MSEKSRIVKPSPTEDGYVYWLAKGDYSHAASTLEEALGLMPGSRKDFEKADKEALTSSPYELFMTRDEDDNIGGYVMRKDIIAWVDASGDNCEDTPESDAFIIPMTAEAFQIDNSHLYEHISDGYGLDHIAEVKEFYLSNILPETHIRRAYGAERILEDLGGMIRKHLSDTDWLGWASMFYHVDILWEMYGGNNYVAKWSKESVERGIITLAELSEGMDWKQVYRILDAIENADVDFNFLTGDPSFFVKIKAYIAEFGWDRVALLLPVISESGSLTVMHSALVNDIDLALIKTVAV